MNIAIEFSIFKTRLGLKSDLKETLLIFWNKFAQRGTSSPKQKEVYITIELSGIRIGLDPKFHFRQTILIFWTIFMPKRCFPSKVGLVDMTTKFIILKLV